ncbi:MAG: flagellar biosynthetic protein FliQ [Planctomycetota bacterium]
MQTMDAMELCRQALLLAAVLATPVLAIGLLSGLLTGILQTLFQVQDQTLSFVPKLIACSLVLLICLPWMFGRLMEFSRAMFAGASF